MSRLRQAAALFVEAGRAVGHVEFWTAIEIEFTELLSACQGTGQNVPEAVARTVNALLALQAERRTASNHAAEVFRLRAEAALADLEHPGARLARRFLVAARAARGAWRAGG